MDVARSRSIKLSPQYLVSRPNDVSIYHPVANGEGTIITTGSPIIPSPQNSPMLIDNGKSPDFEVAESPRLNRSGSRLIQVKNTLNKVPKKSTKALKRQASIITFEETNTKPTLRVDPYTIARLGMKKSLDELKKQLDQIRQEKLQLSKLHHDNNGIKSRIRTNGPVILSIRFSDDSLEAQLFSKEEERKNRKEKAHAKCSEYADSGPDTFTFESAYI